MILNKAKGIQPMRDELLIKNARVIAKVINASYLSKTNATFSFNPFLLFECYLGEV
jgi:hypothetical protein